MSGLISCPLCSRQFDTSENAACQGCPVGAGCALVCCPYCGYTTVDPGQSTVSRLLKRASAWRRGLKPRRQGERRDGSAAGLLQLDAVAPGAEVVVTLISDLPQSKRLQVQAYGLAPGRRVRVLQQSPVTVVRADHTELALEPDLASSLLVKVIG